MRKTIVEELDFSTEESRIAKTNPHLVAGELYVALIDGKYYAGKLYPVWFGYNMDVGGALGTRQFDPPGTNGCNWQKVWRVHEANGLSGAEAILILAGLDPVEIAEQDERRYAEERRRYAIDHELVSGGQRITEESPIEAYLYSWNVPEGVRMMPLKDDEEDEW